MNDYAHYKINPHRLHQAQQIEWNSRNRAVNDGGKILPRNLRETKARLSLTHFLECFFYVCLYTSFSGRFQAWAFLGLTNGKLVTKRRRGMKLCKECKVHVCSLWSLKGQRGPCTFSSFKQYIAEVWMGTIDYNGCELDLVPTGFRLVLMALV